MSKSPSIGFFVTGILCICGLVGGFALRQKAEATPVANSARDLLAAKSGFGELDEVNYFKELAALLRDNYVEPVEIDQKMASGAVRGMVASLLDPDSQFYDPDQLATFRKNQRGEYEGIGIEIEYRFNQKELSKLRSDEGGADSLLLLPELFIASVMPGSPAEQAGILAGDEIRKIGERYVVTGADVKKLRDLQTAVTDKKASADELTDLKNQMQVWVDNNIPSGKARDALMTGTSGEVGLTVRRADGSIKTFSLLKKSVKVPSVTQDGSVHLRLFTGASDALGRIKSPISTLDLRNSGMGDYDEINRLLPLLLPAGEYGTISRPGDSSRSVSIERGVSTPHPFTIVVDRSTHGAAALFANILASSELVTVEGELPPPGQFIELHTLPSGAGYTLSAGTYSRTPLKTASNAGPTEAAR